MNFNKYRFAAIERRGGDRNGISAGVAKAEIAYLVSFDPIIERQEIWQGSIAGLVDLFIHGRRQIHRQTKAEREYAGESFCSYARKNSLCELPRLPASQYIWGSAAAGYFKNTLRALIAPSCCSH